MTIDRRTVTHAKPTPSPQGRAGWVERAAAIIAAVSSMLRFLSGMRRVRSARPESAQPPHGRRSTPPASDRHEELPSGAAQGPRSSQQTASVRVTGGDDDPRIGGLRCQTPDTAIVAGRADGRAEDATHDPIRAVDPPGSGSIRPSPVDPPERLLRPGQPVIGYITIAEDGAEAIDALCQRAGWRLLEIVRDRETATRTSQRPGLNYALRKISAGEAQTLVISNMERLSRSIVELGALMDLFRDGEAVLIGLDLGVDTSTAEGRRVAEVLGTLGAWQRERIAQRTRMGIEEARATRGSVGRPAIKDQPRLAERIKEMRGSGMTLQAIADALNAEGVPTARGGALWRPSSVQTALGYQRPRRGKWGEWFPDERQGRSGAP